MLRSERRHQSERVKRKAAQVNHLWHGNRVLEKCSSNGIVHYYTPQELRRVIGRLDAQHCTHICDMCHYFKGKPKKKYQSVRVFEI